MTETPTSRRRLCGSVAPRLSALWGLPFVLAACGTVSPEEEAGQIFDSTTTTLINFHLDVGDNHQFPATATWECDSGTIELVTEDDEQNGLTLGHEFVDCELDGRVYNGSLPYLDVTRCAAGYALDIVGELQVEGAANFDQCSFDAREHCDGTFSGEACGIPLSDTSFDRVNES